MEWIKVSEQLPKERFQSVLLFNGDAPEYNQHIFQGVWYAQTQNFVRDDKTYILRGTITHWMPLPQPPQI